MPVASRPAPDNSLDLGTIIAQAIEVARYAGAESLDQSKRQADRTLIGLSASG